MLSVVGRVADIDLVMLFDARYGCATTQWSNHSVIFGVRRDENIS